MRIVNGELESGTGGEFLEKSIFFMLNIPLHP
jgi:hypothetical protein